MSPVQQQIVAERYRLVEPLGEGGMGRVWKATDEVLQRTVAVKEIIAPPGLTARERQEMRERSLREARSIARLSHPNVVRIFDVVATEGDPWIVMEFVQSRSLEQVVAEDGVLPATRVAHIGLGVLHALRAAHEAGLVHRDVKPANVLLGVDDRVVLTDFGLATAAGDPTVTRTGVVLGSPAYIAPERARDGSAGPGADLWSLGATLFAAVEGHAPFARQSTIETLAALVSEPIPQPRHAGPLRSALEGLLHKDPSARIDAGEAERRLLRAAGIKRRGGAAPLSAVRRQRAVPPALLPMPVSPGDPPPAAEEAASVSPAPAPVVPAQVQRSTVSEPVPTVAAAAPVPDKKRRPPKAVLVAIAAIAVLAVLAAIIVPSLADDSPRERGSAPEPTPGATSAAPAQPGPTAGATTPSAGAGPATSQAPVLTPPATPAGNGSGLPAGWRMYTDPTGFKVAIPNGWRQSKEGTMVYFREQSGQRRILGIDQTDEPKADPVADWKGLERRRVNAGDWQAYERVGEIHAVNYFVKAADWEYKYTFGGERRHVNNRGVVTSPTQAYGIYWNTPDSTWASNVDELALVFRTFVPGE